MDEIRFSYEITKEDYAESNALICRKVKYPASTKWLMPILGVLILSLLYFDREPDGSLDRLALGLFPLGLLFVYWGLQYHLPRPVAKRHYAATALANHQFEACISKLGILVRGSESEWKYNWSAILLAEESEKVFALYTGLQVFIFAKRHLTRDQIEALRNLISAQPAFPGGSMPKY